MKSYETTLDSRVEALTDIIIQRMGKVNLALIEARLEVLRDPASPFSEADRYRLVSAATELVGIANRVLALAEVDPQQTIATASRTN